MTKLEELLAATARNLEDPLLTPIQVAKRLGVSAASVRRWIRDESLASEPHGPKRRRVRTSVVDALSPRSTRNISEQDAHCVQNAHTMP